MSRRVRTLVGISFLGLYFLANLPLIRMIWIHDGATVIAIIGHSPEQFLFLALLFPAVVLLTYKLTNLTIGLPNRYPSIRNATFWRWLVQRRIILASSLLICLSIATVDIIWTTPDFYHMRRQDASEAAELNKAIITSLSKAETEAEKDKIKANVEFQEKLDRLRDIYNDSDNSDPVTRTFEFLELSAVGLVVSLVMWMLYLNLRLLGFSMHVDDPELSKDLKGEIRKGVPYGVMIVIVYLFWPPLRSYNIFEIRQVTAYQTLNPLNVYGIIAIAAMTLIWLQYSKIRSKFISTLIAVLTFLASGALMGIARLTPESLVDYVGSGMGFGNLFFLGFVLALFYVFGSEVFKQIK